MGSRSKSEQTDAESPVGRAGTHARHPYWPNNSFQPTASTRRLNSVVGRSAAVIEDYISAGVAGSSGLRERADGHGILRVGNRSFPALTGCPRRCGIDPGCMGAVVIGGTVQNLRSGGVAVWV